MEAAARSHVVQRIRPLILLSLGALLVILAEGSPARADNAGDKERAVALLDEGNQLFEDRQYEAALERYESAYAAYASPKILLNIAETHRLLGAADKAAEHYEEFLAKTPESEKKHRKLAQENLEKVLAELGFISVASDPEGAEVRVDGRSVGKTPLEPVRVLAGRRAVSAELEGHQPFKQEVVVRAGQTEEVKISLKSDTPAVTAAPPVDSTPSIIEQPTETTVATEVPDGGSEPITKKWWFWTALGAVVVGGVVLGVVAASGGGSDFVPAGELGKSGTTGWEAFMTGGLR